MFVSSNTKTPVLLKKKYGNEWTYRKESAFNNNVHKYLIALIPCFSGCEETDVRWELK